MNQFNDAMFSLAFVTIFAFADDGLHSEFHQSISVYLYIFLT